MMLHWTTFNATLLREKPIRVINMAINLLQQRCKNLKSVQSCATSRCGNKYCVTNRLPRPCTRIDFLCNNIASKIVVKNRPAV